MTVIGVTGGIGSGKTTFCRFIESRGYPVINADTLAKKLMVEDQELVQKIKENFGNESYHHNGTLNREYLSAKAFQENRVNELNGLVHPVVKREVLAEIKKYADSGADLVFYEAAILLNEGRPDYLDVIVWIEASSEQRLKRVLKRDGTDEQRVQDRMAKQLPIESVRDYVDIVIYNSGSLSDLESEANKLIQQYVR